MATIIALDTATDACSVALQHNNAVFKRFQIAPRQHASLVLNLIDEIRSEAGIQLSEVDAIAVGQGPGSFMGVRIAVGIAQGLAYGIGVSVIPISTLQALAQAAHDRHHAQNILPAWDARMDECYWGAYKADEAGLMQPIQADGLLAPADILAPDEQQWLAVGNAWQTYRDQLTHVQKAANVDFAEKDYPDAKAMLKLAENCYANNQLKSPQDVEPAYLRNNVARAK